MALIQLDLLSFAESLIMRTQEGQREVYDPVRRKFIQLSPEEFVRQLFLQYLIEEKGISRGRIAVERKIKTSKLNKRFDILVFDSEAQALLIVECKSAEVSLTQDVLDQAGIYNTVLRAPYLVVTNGIAIHAYKIDQENSKVNELDHFPSL